METAKSIVVIDDDLPSVEVLVKLLRKAGHQVSYFYDGQTGLAFIKTHKPDLVLSDMLLPNLHGLDLCRKIKSDESLRQIPVVLMTGVYRDPRNRQDVTEAGADGFYTKPFDLVRLVGDLHRLMGQNRQDIVPDEIKDEIETVTAAYLLSLPNKIRELRLLAERLRLKQGNPEALAYLHLQVHALAGSSATFAFNHLSKWASAASTYLRTLLDRKAPLGEPEYAQIETYLYEIQVHSPLKEDELPTPKHLAVLGPLGGLSQEQRRLVFLVEPDLGLACELILEMELFGFEVKRFADEAELNTERLLVPDALVMSFEMPEGQLIRVRENARYHVVPLVFLASSKSMQARLTAIRVGCDAFLTKPLNTGSLVHTIHELTQPQRLPPPRVLLVSSDRELNVQLTNYLEQAELLVKTVIDPILFLDTLKDYSPDVVMVDSTLTGCSAQELVQLFHQDQHYLGVALILLMPTENPVLFQELMGLGADEILVKPLKAGALVSRITHRAMRFRALRAHMVRDTLTGLLNQSSLLHSFGIELERVRRRTESMTVAQIDIDQLKHLNQSCGYLAGNVALRSLASMLTRRLRHSDIIGRFEGPTLLVVLPDTPLELAEQVLFEILTDFARVLHHADEHEYYATITCGLASYPRYKEARALLEASQSALYRGKHLGGNRVVKSE